jgi:5-methylcytosine-specific restriction endonuclease McrA
LAKRGTYIRTEKHRKINSDALKKFYANGGQIWSKGKKFSDKHRASLSLSHLGIVSKPAKASICCNCHNEYYKKDGGSRSKKRKYCSFECYVKATTGSYRPNSGAYGEKNPHWRGGVTSINKIIRGSRKYSDWRKSVFQRDNYTCVFCGVVGGYLEADHIKPFAYFVEHRFDIDNGRTLCKPCHSKTDTYMGRSFKKYKELCK